MQPNLIRMIRLAEEFFDAKNDPSQISVDDAVLQKLRKVHPSTISEESNYDGPVAWVLIIPTTRSTMNEFLSGKITERELLDQVHPGDQWEAVYLCSALVLPEYRGKGIARRLALTALKNLQQIHPITSLYVWTFSPEGDRLAEAISRDSGIRLSKRVTHS